jgi:hypothetical protein
VRRAPATQADAATCSQWSIGTDQGMGMPPPLPQTPLGHPKGIGAQLVTATQPIHVGAYVFITLVLAYGVVER